MRYFIVFFSGLRQSGSKCSGWRPMAQAEYVNGWTAQRQILNDCNLQEVAIINVLELNQADYNTFVKNEDPNQN